MTNNQKRTAIITGVSRIKPIGYGIANRLASDGLNLFLHFHMIYMSFLPNSPIKN